MYCAILAQRHLWRLNETRRSPFRSNIEISTRLTANNDFATTVPENRGMWSVSLDLDERDCTAPLVYDRNQAVSCPKIDTEHLPTQFSISIIVSTADLIRLSAA